ncbi:MAG: PaaI family thioesterase [Deltaproteobacteria bacterium]|nr:PaaI family thioesterase [Deltaproteobacteria bacterium]
MKNTGPHDVKMDNWLSCAPFETLLQMKIESAADGQAVLSMPFLHQFSQGAGLLHGGALTSLADTAVAIACKSLLAPGTHFATLSLESTFLAPVQEGIVTAHAVVTKNKSDQRTLHGQATVKDQNNKEVMRFSSLFRIARRQKKEK